MLITVSAALIVAAWVLLLLQIDPIPTWFYVFAWYPTLVLLDALGSKLDGRASMLWRRPMIFVFMWSPVVWFIFEVANFRLSNWYYVSLPHSQWERWCGIVLSFATVVPALVLAERLLDAAGVFKSGNGPVLRVRQWKLNAAVATGIGMGVMSLALPRLFFPLIWGAIFLIVDPIVYRVQRSLSLLGDLSAGYWGRIGRLLLGGLGIGLLWETYNYWARGKWIYTVPWLEELKLFEMPPFGFIGFPVFTLEAWSMYSGLCLLGVAAPLVGKATIKRRRLLAGTVIGVALSITTLVGMERYTISSTAPRLSGLPDVPPEQLESIQNAGISTVYALAGVDPIELSDDTDLEPNLTAKLVQTARLTTLRGIGNRHAGRLLDLGIDSVCELSRQDPIVLYRQLELLREGTRPNVAEARVWIRAAQRACGAN